jgi:hypothetical protein
MHALGNKSEMVASSLAANARHSKRCTNINSRGYYSFSVPLDIVDKTAKSQVMKSQQSAGE